jgi:hypothetical protein
MAEQKGEIVNFDVERVRPIQRVIVPRPPDLHESISDTVYMGCVRDWILGAEIAELAPRLKKSSVALANMIKTAPWRRMEYLLRDDLKTTVFGRVSRIEQNVLSQIEDRLHNGDYAYDMFGKEYRQQLSVKKLIELHRRVAETKVSLDKDLSGKKEEDEVDTKQILAMLEDMAEARKADPVSQAIDVTPDDAIENE